MRVGVVEWSAIDGRIMSEFGYGTTPMVIGADHLAGRPSTADGGEAT